VLIGLSEGRLSRFGSLLVYIVSCHKRIKRNVEVETTSGRSLMYTRNNSGANTVPCGPQKVHQASLTHTLQLAPVVFLKTRNMLSIVGFFHGLHSDKVYEVIAYAGLCQTLW
jgi:hypothetical protein